MSFPWRMISSLTSDREILTPGAMAHSRTIFSPTWQVSSLFLFTTDCGGRTEVSDLEVGTVVVGDSVNGEMCVDQSHLVEEALGYQSMFKNLLLQSRPTFVTPMIMFSTKDLMVLRQATCFRAPCQMVNWTFRSLAVLTWRLVYVLGMFVERSRARAAAAASTRA
jgi:hypothetical protein